MASWGMAAYTGRKMWEDARKTQEENERLLAERRLFDLGIKEAEQDAELQAQAKKESRRIQSLINAKKTDLQAGGERGAKALAEVYSGLFGKDGATWSAKDGVLYELDRDGNTVNAVDLRRVSGIAMLSMAQQFVPTAEEAAAAYQTAEALNQKAIHEIQMKMLELENEIRVAQTNGASSAVVAKLRGEYALAEQEMRNRSALDIKSLDVQSAQSAAQFGFQESMAKMWDTDKVNKWATTRAVGTAIPGGIPQYDTSGNFIGAAVINPTTNDVVPVELTPEMRSGIISQRDQLVSEGAGKAAATGYMAPPVVYMGHADSGMTQRRDAEMAALLESVQQATQSVGNVPVPGAGLKHVQMPMYGNPQITTLQSLPTVYNTFNPSTGLPVAPQIFQDVRQGLAQQRADSFVPSPTMLDPMNVYSFGHVGLPQ